MFWFSMGARTLILVSHTLFCCCCCWRKTYWEVFLALLFSCRGSATDWCLATARVWRWHTSCRQVGHSLPDNNTHTHTDTITISSSSRGVNVLPRALSATNYHLLVALKKFTDEWVPVINSTESRTQVMVIGKSRLFHPGNYSRPTHQTKHGDMFVSLVVTACN